MSKTVLGMILAVASLSAWAASPSPQATGAGAAQQRVEHTQRYYEQRQQHPRPETTANPILNAAGAGPHAARTAGPAFVLKALRFSPSHFLSKKTLDEIAKPYIGKRIHMSDLQTIVSRINQRYVDRSIYTARAILPAQRIRDGVVHVDLIEGRLGELQITHNAYTRDGFIRSRISQQPGKVVDGAQLKRDLVFFNRTSDVQLHAVMRPGAEKGLTQILLLAQEPDRFRLDPFIDNAGSESTGRYRGGFSLRLFDPLGMDDRFDGYFVGAAGELAGFASYSLPVNHLNGRLGVSYSRNAIDIVHGPFEDLNITGHSSTEAVNFTQPFVANAHWLASWASSMSHTTSETDAEDINIASSTTEQLASGVTVEHNAGHHQWSITQTLNGVHSKETLDDKHDFFVYDGQASYLQAFGISPYSLLLQIGGQYAPDDQLPSQTLFQIGGVDTVRGYEQGVVAGSSGFYGQLELHRSIRHWLDGFAFVDGGGVYQAFPSKQYLASAGPGLSFHYARWLTGDLSVGFPLETVTPDQDDYRINFRIAMHWAP